MKKIVMEGVVGWEFGSRALREMIGETDDLRVYLHSPGGSVTDGMAVAGTLRLHALENRKKVEIVGVGLVASIATHILMSGTRVMLDKQAFMMIHNSSGGSYGGSKDMRDTADTLETIDKAMLSAYVAKIQANGKADAGTEGKVRKMMEDETWLTADQALELGLIDEVIESPEQAPPADLKAFAEGVKILGNIPTALAAKYAPPAAPPAPAPNKPISEPKNQDKVNKEKLGIFAAIAAFLFGNNNTETDPNLPPPAAVAVPPAPPAVPAPENMPPALVALVSDTPPPAPAVPPAPPVAVVPPAPDFAALTALQAELDKLKAQYDAKIASMQAELDKKAALPLPPPAAPAKPAAPAPAYKSEALKFAEANAHLFD